MPLQINIDRLELIPFMSRLTRRYSQYRAKDGREFACVQWRENRNLPERFFPPYSHDQWHLNCIIPDNTFAILSSTTLPAIH